MGEFKDRMRDGTRNWRESEMAFHRRVLRAACNQARKAATLKRCCGHHGEPGC